MPRGTGSKMFRVRTSTRAIVSPSRLRAESGATGATNGCGRAPVARSGGAAANVEQTSSAPRASALTRRAQSLTGQLGLSGERVPLDEIGQGLSRLAGLIELLLAERQLVEGGRDAIPIRIGSADPS